MAKYINLTYQPICTKFCATFILAVYNKITYTKFFGQISLSDFKSGPFPCQRATEYFNSSASSVQSSHLICPNFQLTGYGSFRLQSFLAWYCSTQ